MGGRHQSVRVAGLRRNTQYGDLVYVSKVEPDKVVRYWQPGDYSVDKLKHGWMPPHPTFYVRRS